MKPGPRHSWQRQFSDRGQPQHVCTACRVVKTRVQAAGRWETHYTYPGGSVRIGLAPLCA